jgi:hypothetical protein
MDTRRVRSLEAVTRVVLRHAVDPAAVIASAFAWAEWGPAAIAERLWRGLAIERPEVFCGRVSRGMAAEEFALRYSRRNEPSLVRAFRMTGEERRLLAAGRDLVGEWSSVPLPSRCLAWEWADESAFAATVRLGDPDATACAIRRTGGAACQIAVSDRAVRALRGRESSQEVAVTLVLHEQLHHAVAAAAASEDWSWLGFGVEEAAVSLVELAVDFALMGGDTPTRGLIESMVRGPELCHCNQKLILALLRALPGCELPELADCALRAAVACRRSGSDADAAAVLNEVSGRSHRPDWWRQRFRSGIEDGEPLRRAGSRC